VGATGVAMGGFLSNLPRTRLVAIPSRVVPFNLVADQA
jgi:hypothetical protein